MQPEPILVSQLNVGDIVVMETGEQRAIKALDRGIYYGSRLIDLGRENGKEVWACLLHTEKVLAIKKESV